MYNNLVSALYFDHDFSVFMKAHFVHNKEIWGECGKICQFSSNDDEENIMFVKSECM